MKAAFHYIVKAKVIRKTESNEPAFEEVSKKFENENPIIAREEAFRFYQSWIDILLQSKNKEYSSDKEARKELISFIDPGVSIKLDTGYNEIEFNNISLGNGIGVFFVIDQSVEAGDYSYWEAGDELLIHGIGNLFEKYMSEKYLVDRTIISLHTENDYYKYFNYETRNKEREVTYFMWMCWADGIEDGALNTHKILDTPFNWEGYDKPFWWGKPNEEKEKEIVQPVSKSIEEIIEQGESNTVEFKPCLVYNFKTNKGGISIKEIIAKSICGFLNSNGGFLFIGINDNKTVQGLHFDFSLANGKDPKDYFLLEFDNMLQRFLSFSIKGNINTQFYLVEGKEIFAVFVSPSKERPIFLKGQEGKEFYVRGEASTRQIKDVEEIINYCIGRSKQ